MRVGISGEGGRGRPVARGTMARVKLQRDSHFPARASMTHPISNSDWNEREPIKAKRTSQRESREEGRKKGRRKERCTISPYFEYSLHTPTLKAVHEHCAYIGFGSSVPIYYITLVLIKNKRKLRTWRDVVYGRMKLRVGILQTHLMKPPFS